MATVKIIIIAMQKPDLELLIEEIKTKVAKGTCWVEGPFPSPKGFKAFLTFDIQREAPEK